MFAALAWVFAGDALASDPNGLLDRAASAGATTVTDGWRASLFVTQPTTEDEALGVRGSSTVGARFSRPLSRNARVSVDVFNVFDKQVGEVDYFAAARAGFQPGIADNYLFHPAAGRGIRLGFKLTFK